MAVVTTNNMPSHAGFDFRLLDVAALFFYDFSSLTPPALRLFDDASNFTLFSGTGIAGAFDGLGSLTSIDAGTVAGVRWVVGGVDVIKVTGANASAVALFNAYVADDTQAFVNLVLAGNDTVNGTASADYLVGAGGNDKVNGLAGNDTLLGGTGIDTLTGGTGKDTLTGGASGDFFVFNSVLNAITNVDRITDFSAPADTIRLENGIFTAFAAVGAIAADAFHQGAAAHDATDRIIYNPLNGALNYDSNGDAAGGTIRFATLSAGLTLSALDFVVI